MQAALNDAYAHGAAGRDIFGSGFSLDVVVHPGAGAYICGEETALLESLEGKRGFPRIKPPFFPAVHGLYGEPTVVNNVETMANIPWIISNGGAAFAAAGEGRATGTRPFALGGRLRHPGPHEQRRGALRRAGRGTADRYPPLRFGRSRPQPRHLRAGDGQDHLPRPDLR